MLPPLAGHLSEGFVLTADDHFPGLVLPYKVAKSGVSELLKTVLSRSLYIHFRNSHNADVPPWLGHPGATACPANAPAESHCTTLS